MPLLNVREIDGSRKLGIHGDMVVLVDEFADRVYFFEEVVHPDVLDGLLGRQLGLCSRIALVLGCFCGGFACLFIRNFVV